MIELIGNRYGKLIVVEELERNHNKKRVFRCVCDCGKETTVIYGNLTQGNTKSCGCARVEFGRTMHKVTHGCGTKDAELYRLYDVWHSMKSRCYRETASNYQNYGGRGIGICDEWRNSFEAFRDWALASGYDVTAKRGDCTIDRIDVNGNYEPSNCRWVSMKIQQNNKRQKRQTA